MKVSQIMTHKPACITPDTTIQEAIDRLYGMDVHHLPVVLDSKLLGLITDKELRTFLVPRDVLASDPGFNARLREPVASVLKGKPLFAYTDAEISEVIEGMVANYVDAIPILSRENHEVVGIVSYIDILRVAISYL